MQYNMHAVIHAPVVWVITSCKRHPYVHVGMYIYTYPSVKRRHSRVQDIWQGYIIYMQVCGLMRCYITQ